MVNLKDCEKATKFEKISHLFWRLLSDVKISKNLKFIGMHLKINSNFKIFLDDQIALCCAPKSDDWKWSTDKGAFIIKWLLNKSIYGKENYFLTWNFFIQHRYATALCASWSASVIIKCHKCHIIIGIFYQKQFLTCWQSYCMHFCTDFLDFIFAFYCLDLFNGAKV